MRSYVYFIHKSFINWQLSSSEVCVDASARYARAIMVSPAMQCSTMDRISIVSHLYTSLKEQTAPASGRLHTRTRIHTQSVYFQTSSYHRHGQWQLCGSEIITRRHNRCALVHSKKHAPTTFRNRVPCTSMRAYTVASYCCRCGGRWYHILFVCQRNGYFLSRSPVRLAVCGLFRK